MLVFELTMPNVGSWNGEFSGAGKLYAVTKDIRGDKAKKIIEGSSYSYSWDDGWCASIEVYECDGAYASKIRRKSSGFMGYEWMVESIIEKGKITA